MKINRRSFIKNTALASSSILVPNFLKAFQFQNGGQIRSGKVLVMIQLSGGNDGLNAIVPYADDLYYSKRPRLGIASSDVIRLNDHLGFNPAFSALQEIYDKGFMTIINNVGYPNPDRSHFRSMDIWQSASPSNEYWRTGWIGRFLDNQCNGCDTPYSAIEVDDSLSLAMKGSSNTGFAFQDPKRLFKTSNNKYLKYLNEQFEESEFVNKEVDFLYKTMIDTQSSARYIFEKHKTYNSKIEYPRNAFAKDLKLIAELITADTGTKVYYASLGGFDTHANQKNMHNRLLKQYADSVSAFIKDLESNGLLKDTIIVTFSEFGRRVKQNASGGTDHGTANNVYVMGGDLKKPGIFNQGPDLKNLDNG
ncbi:MAG: DUF1501 domain-containing protein, partial [Bacteroidota bacterium]